MTYEEALDFIEQTKQFGSVLGLQNIINLMRELGNVQEELQIIHVAGTNGKGSVCAMLAQIYQEASYRVGKYSSPAVFSYEEIYQIDGEPITAVDFTHAVELVSLACRRLTEAGKPHPTVFEMETAIAFIYFYEKKCDLVILETGMGGETDATNLITSPLCSVVTSISMDHMGFLGTSINEIAGVKAGIIKEGRPVISVCQQPEAMRVLQIQAQRKGAELTTADVQPAEQISYDAEGLSFVYPLFGKAERWNMRLTGSYQVENAVLAITTVEQVCRLGIEVTVTHVRTGLRKARLPGRFETICKSPRMIIDGAHNEDAARKLKDTIENCFTNEEITYIIGVLADKEYEKILRLLLPYAKRVYTVTPDNPRALPGEELCKEAKKYHSHVSCAGTVERAVELAVKGTRESGVILAFGSLSYLAEVKLAVNTCIEAGK